MKHKKGLDRALYIRPPQSPILIECYLDNNAKKIQYV